MTGKDGLRRFSADSLVKLVLIGSLALALVSLNIAILVRAIFSEDVDPQTMLDIFDGYLALFGIVVGYVLGKQGHKNE